MGATQQLFLLLKQVLATLVPAVEGSPKDSAQPYPFSFIVAPRA
jgi:hypothetical protein